LRKVAEAKGRVFVLEFKTSNKKLFFWLQEISTEKDDQYCVDVNKFINNPPQPGTPETGGGGDMNNNIAQLLANAQGGGQGQLQEILRAMQQGGGGRPQTRTPTNTRPTSTTTTPTRPTTSTTTTPSNNSNAIKNMLSNLAKREERVQPSLVDVVNVEEIIKTPGFIIKEARCFNNEEIVKKLVEFLPEGGPVNAENIKENLNSNQFKEAVRMFNQALRSGNMVEFFLSFGLDASQIGPTPTIEDFLLAIQKQATKEKESK